MQPPFFLYWVLSNTEPIVEKKKGNIVLEFSDEGVTASYGKSEVPNLLH